MPKTDGCRGSELHEDIVHWARNDMANLIRSLYPGIRLYCVCADLMACALLGTPSGRPGAYYPDALYLYGAETDEQGIPLAIEVGRFQPDRAPADLPVLHIGFSGQVSLLNAVPGDPLAPALRDLFAVEFERRFPVGALDAVAGGD
jgi:hypothetical protein